MVMNSSPYTYKRPLITAVFLLVLVLLVMICLRSSQTLFFGQSSLSNPILTMSKPDTSNSQSHRIFTYTDGRIVLYPDRQVVTKQLSSLTTDERSEFAQRIVNPHDAECSTHRRLGKRKDGGWDLCLVGPYTPKSPCLVMSFGVDSTWGFDDEIGKTFDCAVKAFDPTMKEKDHQRNKWVAFFKKGLGSGPKVVPQVGPVDSLLNLLKSLKLQDQTVDVLKMDVEWSEWDALKTAFEDGSLSKVKQLAIEFHMSQYPSVAEAEKIQFTLNGLYKQGFRAWNYNWNIGCKYQSGKVTRTQCNEVYFINYNFLSQDNLIT